MTSENNPNIPEEEVSTSLPASPSDEPQFQDTAPEIPCEPAQEDGSCVAESAAFTTVFEIPEDTGTVDEAEASAATETPVPQPSMEDTLYHELLTDPVVGEEIGADEQAVYHAGLTHPADAEIIRILDEAKTMDTPAQEVQPKEEAPRQQPFMDEEYRDTFGENGEGLSAVFDAPAPDYDYPIPDYEDPPTQESEPVQEEDPPLPKRRPKMKKGYGLLGIPHILATAIWLVIVVVIGVSLGRMIWVCASEVLAFGRPDKEYVLTVSDGDNIDTIAAKLKNAGLIKYPELFKFYADLTDAEEEISSGTFTLNSKYDYMALVNSMSYHSSARETIDVVVPEGYTCAQIFALLEENGVCTVAELEEYAANGEIKDRWFLEGITRGDKYCLEGYLFPDTYEFYTNDEPGRVIGKFLDNFDARFTDIMKERIDTLNQRMAAVLASRGYTEEQIEERKFTIRKIVIIASMIERETANDAESYDVSSVIYNRLTNPANFPYLNIDATIIYALGGNIDPETGKSKPLTSADLELDSPYNTYTVKGLIPGPISNPGRNSLNAALDPTETNFYYYVFNPNTGEHMFAQTAAQHEKNVNYVRSLTTD